MARVTVEDCIEKVENRSSWCCWRATGRACCAAGAPLTIDRDRDKNPVVPCARSATRRSRPTTSRSS